MDIKIDNIQIQPGRMVVDLCVLQKPFLTDAALAKKVLDKKPTLAAHSCKNERGPFFGDVIADTSIPHLFEHLIIDEQVCDDATDDDFVFVGNTTWLDRKAGTARIAVNFANDKVALSALNRALDFIAEL